MPFFFRVTCLTVAVLCCFVVSSVAAQIVLFDESHAQQFVIDKNGPLDLSGLAALYQNNGFTVTHHSEGLTRETLSAVDVLVLSGPFLPLTEAEIEAVLEFVDGGGGLAVMLHIAAPVANLLHRLDVDFTNGTLREMSKVIDDNALNFKVSAMADHPVTANLDHFSVYGTWALRATAAHAMVLAETSKHAWVDRDRDNQLTEVDAMQKFGVMVVGKIGNGRYIVIGDDALFQNRFLDESNRQLAVQLINWLATQ